MRLYEYQAKGILAQEGLPVPRGELAKSAAEAQAVALRLGPTVVKVQVLAGGRGRAGGVRPAVDAAEAYRLAEGFLTGEFFGQPVREVYVEERLTPEAELYLAVAIDPRRRQPVILAARHGGQDVEEMAEVIRREVPVPWGYQAYLATELAEELKLPRRLAAEFGRILAGLYRVWERYDAELVEVNPLMVVGDRLYLADARLNVDDSALYRQPAVPRNPATPTEEAIRRLGLSFVELPGDIAVLANGAGLAMATLDVLERLGGRPANFLDAGGGAAWEPTAEALKIILGLGPRVLLVNIFGGITRCDEVARALLAVPGAVGGSVPVVVRLAGTNREEGARLLTAAGLRVYAELEEAAREAVSLAGGAVWPS